MTDKQAETRADKQADKQAEKQAETRAEKQADQQADTPAAVNILLVDEQPASLASLAALLRRLLVDHGGAVIAVGSREAAVHAATLHPLAVIVLNVHAPAAGGMATAAVLRADRHMQAVPIIFLLGDDVADFPVEQAYALGAVDYVSKPCNPVVLRARVAVFLDLHRKAVALAEHREVRYLADLRLRDERIGLILDSARDYAFIGMDADGIITEWEGGAADIVGAAGEQARGRSVAMIFSAQDPPTASPSKRWRARWPAAVRSTSAGTCAPTANAFSPTA